MTAKEMFEELGYKVKKELNSNHEVDLIIYSKYQDPKRLEVKFFPYRKEYCTDVYCVDMKLNKAINQQCKELGWLGGNKDE